jgi:outer membrane protein with beta-barrel domain
MKRYRALFPVLAIVALFVASPALAQDHTFKVFAAADWISPLSEDDQTISGVTDSIQASDELGYEAGFEWRLHKIVGLEGSYLDAQHDIEFGGDKVAEIDQKTITAALNFHILPTKFFDFWVAPVASWVNWGDVEPEGGGPSQSVDSDVAFGAAIGFDIGLGKTFAITAGVRWLSQDIKADTPSGTETVGVDPLIARAGIALRFGTR